MVATPKKKMFHRGGFLTVQGLVLHGGEHGTMKTGAVLEK